MCNICNFCLKEVKDESTVRLLDWMIYNIWLKYKILRVAVKHSPIYTHGAFEGHKWLSLDHYGNFLSKKILVAFIHGAQRNCGGVWWWLENAKLWNGKVSFWENLYNVIDRLYIVDWSIRIGLLMFENNFFLEPIYMIIQHDNSIQFNS